MFQPFLDGVDGGAVEGADEVHNTRPVLREGLLMKTDKIEVIKSHQRAF